MKTSLVFGLVLAPIQYSQAFIWSLPAPPARPFPTLPQTQQCLWPATSVTSDCIACFKRYARPHAHENRNPSPFAEPATLAPNTNGRRALRGSLWASKDARERVRPSVDCVLRPSATNWIEFYLCCRPTRATLHLFPFFINMNWGRLPSI